MSDPDTDDTDALLAYKPPTFGAIENFLGLSLGEISNKINILSKSPNNNSVPEENESTTSHENFDTSDFFNSKGELVLSGLSEFSDSDEDSDAGSDAGSVASSASTNSITVLKAGALSQDQECPENSEEKYDNDRAEKLNSDLENISKQVELLSINSDKKAEKEFENASCIIENGTDENLNKALVRSGELQASDIEKHINNSSGNLIQFSFDKYKSPNYGIRYSPGFGRQGINVLRPSPNSGWRVPPGLEDDPQIFTRAPNFRTPGGYKPPTNPKPPRDLTQEQVEEEVRKMYAFPEEIENEGENTEESSGESKPKGPRQVTFFDTETESETEDCDSKKETTSHGATAELENQIIPEENSLNISPSLKFDFTNGIKEPPEFCGKGKGKPIKRKLIPGGGDGNTVGSIPNLNFGLRDLSKLEVKERPINRTRSWVTGHDKDKTNGKESTELASKSTANVNVASPALVKQKKVNFSDLDNLWRDIRDTKLRMDKEVKNSTDNLQALSISDLSSATHALNIDFDQSKDSTTSSNDHKSEEKSVPKSENAHYFVSRDTPGNSQPSFQNVRVVKKASSEKQRLKNSSGNCLAGRSIDPYEKKSCTNIDDSKEKFETLSESDLDSILKEADIGIDDFEDILDKFSDEMPIDELFGAAAAYSKNDEGEEMVYSMEQSDISDWAKSGAGEYLEKFHEEKYKRQRCESEIESLQKELLALKQQNAVLDGGLKKKDTMFLQISMAWNRLSKGWKSHEAASKVAMTKLQKDQQSLVLSCRQSKERILQYEKELARAVEVADSFKAKIQDVETEKTTTVQELSFENKHLSDRITELELLLQDSQKEKEATVRALRDCQIKLDERKLLEKNVYKELSELEKKTTNTTKKFEQVSEQKEELEKHLQTITSVKASLETQVNCLHEELREETASKSRMEKEFQSTITEKVKQESDRLHEYYNRKVQEILSAATEKAASVEASLLNNMKKAASEADQRLQECKSRYKTEMESMKMKYESEMQALIRENTQKQNLIAATAQQLQTGELAISQTTDRLQSIVSSISKPQPTSSVFNGVSHQRRGSESNASPMSYQILNGHPSKYARQSHTLPSSSAAEASSGLQTNFEPSHFTRYNTSTPVSLPPKSNMSLSSAVSSDSNLKQSRYGPELQLPPLDHLLSNPKLLHIITEMSMSSQGQGSMRSRTSSVACSQLVPPLSCSYGEGGESTHYHKIKSITKYPAAYIDPPIAIAAEIPVRLENSPREDPEIITTATQPNDPSLATRSQQSIFEPRLHKALQNLAKCYAEKLDQRKYQSDASKHSSSNSDNENYAYVSASRVDSQKNSLTLNVASDYANNELEINKGTNVSLPGNKKRLKETSESIVDSSQTKAGKNSNLPHNSKRPWK